MPEPVTDNRRAIIDVGSNSVRLVIYEGPERTPFEAHNEKVQARLGRALAETGAIDGEAYAKALEACRRYKALLDATGIAAVRTVATAAARDASNGSQFLRDLAEIGLAPVLLSGKEEAAAAAAGVLSAFPGARGLVGDLGGGSLELVAVGGDGAGRADSFPFGVLRLPALRAKGDKTFASSIKAMLDAAGWRKSKAGREFYLVGGSWRALGHLDMHLAESPLPGVHGYAFPAARLPALRKAITDMGAKALRAVPGMTASRIATLDDAAALLEAVCAVVETTTLVVSGFGLREGLLFQRLGPEAQAQDPLLAATADYIARRGNPRWDGAAVDAWIAPLFSNDDKADCRIRRAACDLAGADLHPLTETRARHGMELAWLGGWVALSAGERAMLAQAMWTAWGGKGDCVTVSPLLGNPERRKARQWGEAIRLAERVSGGVTAVLSHACLAVRDGVIGMELSQANSGLAGGVAARQLGVLRDVMAPAS